MHLINIYKLLQIGGCAFTLVSALHWAYGLNENSSWVWPRDGYNRNTPGMCTEASTCAVTSSQYVFICTVLAGNGWTCDWNCCSLVEQVCRTLLLVRGEILQQNIQRKIPTILSGKWILHHENDPTHATIFAKQFFTLNNVPVKQDQPCWSEFSCSEKWTVSTCMCWIRSTTSQPVSWWYIFNTRVIVLSCLFSSGFHVLVSLHTDVSLRPNSEVCTP